SGSGNRAARATRRRRIHHNSHARARVHRVTLGRFFRTPKGLTLLVLGAMTIVATVGEGARLVVPGLVAAIVAAAVIDAVVLRLRKKRWVFPDGALLTAIIVVAVL